MPRSFLKNIGNGFKKGVSGNPKGRPKGSRNYKLLLESALGRISKECDGHGKKNGSLFMHAIRVAYKDNDILKAILNYKITCAKSSSPICS